MGRRVGAGTRGVFADYVSELNEKAYLPNQRFSKVTSRSPAVRKPRAAISGMLRRVNMLKPNNFTACPY